MPAAEPVLAEIPLTEAAARARAGALGLAVPDECLPGVLANLALLCDHAARLLEGPDA